MEILYRIEELDTTGWALVEESAIKLPRHVAEEKLNRLMQLGHNPNYLRVVVDND
jgi:hypothetical protein